MEGMFGQWPSLGGYLPVNPSLGGWSMPDSSEQQQQTVSDLPLPYASVSMSLPFPFALQNSQSNSMQENRITFNDSNDSVDFASTFSQYCPTFKNAGFADGIESLPFSNNEMKVGNDSNINNGGGSKSSASLFSGFFEFDMAEDDEDGSELVESDPLAGGAFDISEEDDDDFEDEITREEADDVLREAGFGHGKRQFKAKLTPEQILTLKNQVLSHTQLLIQVNLLALSDKRLGANDIYGTTKQMLQVLANLQYFVHSQLPIKENVVPNTEGVMTRSLWNKLLEDNPDLKSPLDNGLIQKWTHVMKSLEAEQKPDRVNMLNEVKDFFRAALQPKSYICNEILAPLRKGLLFTAAEDRLLQIGISLFGTKDSIRKRKRVVKIPTEPVSELPNSWKSIQYRFLPAKSSTQIRQRYRTIMRRQNSEFEMPIARFNEITHQKWTDKDRRTLLEAYEKVGNRWGKISRDALPQFDRKAIRREYLRLEAKKFKFDEEKTEDVQAGSNRKRKSPETITLEADWSKEQDRIIFNAWREYGDDIKSWPSDQIEELSHQIDAIQERLLYLFSKLAGN